MTYYDPEDFKEFDYKPKRSNYSFELWLITLIIILTVIVLI